MKDRLEELRQKIVSTGATDVDVKESEVEKERTLQSRPQNRGSGPEDQTSTSHGVPGGVTESEEREVGVKGLVKSMVPRKKKQKMTDLEEGSAETSQKEPGSNEMTGFFNEISQIRQKLLKMRKNVDTMSGLHSKALTAISEKEEQRAREQLDQLMTETSLLAVDIRNALKVMEEDNREFEEREKGSTDCRIRTSQHGALTKKFLAIMRDYQDMQNKYREKYRQRMERQYRIVNPNAKDQEIRQMLDSNSGPIFAQQILAAGQPETKKTLQEIKDRHQELQKLERSIVELHQLFLDMAVLIEAQGEVINEIDQNVEQAVNYTAEGYHEMRKAVVYQKRARKKIVILVICIIILILAIALPLALTLGAKH